MSQEAIHQFDSGGHEHNLQADYDLFVRRYDAYIDSDEPGPQNYWAQIVGIDGGKIDASLMVLRAAGVKNSLQADKDSGMWMLTCTENSQGFGDKSRVYTFTRLRNLIEVSPKETYYGLEISDYTRNTGVACKRIQLNEYKWADSSQVGWEHFDQIQTLFGEDAKLLNLRDHGKALTDILIQHHRYIDKRMPPGRPETVALRRWIGLD